MEWYKTTDGYSYQPNEYEPYEDGKCPNCDTPTYRQEDGTLYCMACNTIYTSQRNPFIDQKEMHKSCRCTDQLFYYFGEIEKLWSENNLSCECIKDLFQEKGIDLLNLSDKSEEIHYFLQEIVSLIKGFQQ
jgi:hypothetical protein